MGYVRSPNNWAPYDATYRECSQGICSLYCPQWCSMVFPPPPPFFPEEDDDDNSKTNFSPLIIAIIGILASTVLLVIYYTLISKYCRRRRDRQNRINQIGSDQTQMDRHDDLQWQVPSTGGLEEGLIKSIAVCKYKKGDGLVEGTECVVCLSEFQEDESLRLLPKCSHAFHLPCIDTWLKSHSNCPICRASVVVSGGNSQISSSSTTVNVSSLEVQRREDDLVFVVDGGREREGEVVVSFGGGDEIDDSGSPTPSVRPFRRSISVDSADHDQDPRMEIRRLPPGIGSSGEIWGDDRRSTKDGNGLFDLARSPVAGVKRSASTERIKITKNEKGKDFTIPV